MNSNIRQLADDAGFVFWGNEAWGPGPSNIDWSNEYDAAFDAYTVALIQRCARIASDRAYGVGQAERAILDYFGIQSKEQRILLQPKEDQYGNN